VVKTFNGDTDLFTPAEVAAIWNVDPKTVTRWARAGKMRCIRTLGGARRYYRGEVEGRLEGRPLSDAQYDALMDRAVGQR
jgi:excisionase family DNA binding protein